uniref:Uncharacterized protein n=1 Tax=Eutreptiella gymnastica TaxID=73025 RepID=A0A7S4CCR7_9EUGL
MWNQTDIMSMMLQRYAVMEPLKIVAEYEVQHLKAKFLSRRRPRTVVSQQPYPTLEEFNANFYRGILETLGNALKIQQSFECMRPVHAPVHKVVALWREFAWMQHDDPDFPWSTFIQHHYELYSSMWAEFLTYARTTELLKDWALENVNRSTSEQPVFSNTGPRLLSSVVRGLQPLRKELLMMHKDTLRRDGTSPRIEHGSPPFERYGTMNPNTFADKEIFSPSLLKEVVDTLKNAWSYGPSDFEEDLRRLTEDFNTFFCIEDSPLEWKEFAVPDRIGLQRREAKAGEPPARQATKSLGEPIAPLTDEGRAQILSGMRSCRSPEKFAFWGDPDNKPIVPSENRLLVRWLLRLQRTLGPPLREHIGFKLRLRWLASYWALFVLVVIWFIFGFWGQMLGFLLLNVIFSWISP